MSEYRQPPVDENVFAKQRNAMLERWRTNWRHYGHQVLNQRLWTKQQLHAIRTIQGAMKCNGGKGRVGIKSGHGTGKTWLAAFCAHAFVGTIRNSVVLCMSSSGPQLKERLWAEFRRIYRRTKIRLGGALLSNSLKFNEKWKVLATSPANPDNFQGEHADNICIIFDEAQAVAAEFWEAAHGMLGSTNPLFIFIGNPLYVDGPFFEEFQRPDQNELITFNCLEHENVVTGKTIIPGAVTRDWVEEREARWGKDSVLYQTRVLGEFPKSAVNTLVSLTELHGSADKTVEEIGLPEGTFIGADIGRQGDDPSYICVMSHGRVIHMDSWHHKNTMETLGRILLAAEDYDVPDTHINIDGVGVGAGVVDRAREMGRRVNDIQAAASPVGDQHGFIERNMRFLNRRAELYWAVRERVRQGYTAIPRQYAQAYADLIATRYYIRSDTAIAVEGKDEIKKRLHRSPDAGDAVMLAHARAANARPTITLV